MRRMNKFWMKKFKYLFFNLIPFIWKQLMTDELRLSIQCFILDLMTKFSTQINDQYKFQIKFSIF